MSKKHIVLVVVLPGSSEVETFETRRKFITRPSTLTLLSGIGNDVTGKTLTLLEQRIVPN